MIVVSKEGQLKEPKVALAFLRNFMGEKTAMDVFAAFTAISSLGNIIVVTFTAARVKQEIAKEGVLPFAKFFGESSVLRWGPNDSHGSEPEPTPIGALLLHWSFSVLLIVVTWRTKPSVSYKILVNISSYTVEAFFSFILGIGMLCLRFRKTSSGRSWRDKSPANHYGSTISDAICVIAHGFPLVASWFPPTPRSPEAIKEILLKYYPWFATATVGWSVLACSVVYWLVFRFVLPQIGNRRGSVFVVERHPHFHTEHGYDVEYHEIVAHNWVVEQEPPTEPEYELNNQRPSHEIANG